MKKFFKSVTAAALVAAGAASFTLGLSACAGKTQSTERPTNVDITKTEAPKDGSLPTAHSAAENLSYIAYVLDAQSQYHCYTYTVTSAAIATQYTKSYKDYRDGVTISSDITYSSMVKSGSQACFVEGENGPEAYMRFSSAPSADTTHLTANWSQDAPVHYGEQAYLYTYGLFQTELTNYIINADTIAESGEVKANGDGTYTQSVMLDPIASTYYYQFGMKTRGGLSGYPEFQSVSLSFTFDGEWRILSMDIDEVSLVNKGVTVTSVSKSRVEYSYDDASFDEQHFDFYDSYFRQYVGDDTLEEGGDYEEEMTIDLTSVLSNGFSKIMDGGQQFQITAELGQNRYVGYIFVALDLADPLNSLQLKLSLGKTLEEQGFYLEYAQGQAEAYYGEDFALNVNIAALKPIIEQFTDWADGLNCALSSLTSEGEGSAALSSDALSDLMNIMQLEVQGENARIVLKTDDLLGLGIGVDIQLFFGIGENDITFHGASIKGLSFGGSGIDLALSLTTTTAPVIDRESTSASADLADYAADIFNLLSSDLIKVDIALDGNSQAVNISALKGLSVSASAYVDIDGITVGADINISYKRGADAISAQLKAYYDYDASSANYGRLIIEVSSINGKATDIGAVCDLSEVAEAVPALLSLAGLQTDIFSAQSVVPSQVADIINSVLSCDLSDLIGVLYADKAQIKAAVNIDDLLSALSVNTGVQFGYCRLVYTAGGDNGGNLSAALPAMGLSLNVSGADGGISLPDTEGYLNVSDLINVVTNAWSSVEDIISRGRITLEIAQGEAYITYGGATLSVDGAVSADWNAGSQTVALDLNVRLASNGSAVTRVQLVYDKNCGSSRPLIRLALNGAAMDIYSADIGSALGQISDISTALSPARTGTDEQVQLFALVFGILSDGSWVDVLNKMTLSSDGQSVVLSYLSDAAAEIKVDTFGGLSLSLGLNYGGLDAAAKVSVGQGDIFDEVYAQIGTYNPVSTAQGGSFVKVIYDYLFDAFEAIDLTDVLGGSYRLSLSLNGSNSNIEQIKNVLVNADIYLSQYEGENILETDVWLNINSVEVRFDIIVRGGNIYASVTNITGKEIPHLKIKTTADSLYSLISDLVDTAVQSGVLGGGKWSALSQSSLAAGKATATDFIYSLVNFDFDGAFVCAEAGGVKSVTVDLDNVLSQFGIPAPAVGSVMASVSGTSISASAMNGGREWLSITSGTEKKDYSSFNPDEYIDFSSVTALPVTDMLNLLNSENLRISLGFDANDLKINATAYLNISGLAASVEADIAYTYCDMPISASVAAYYDGEGGVYLHVTKLQGRDYKLGVFCDVNEMSEAVSNLLAALQVEATGGGIFNVANADVSQLVTNALSAQYSLIFSGVYADKNGLGVNIDGDKLLSELGLDLGLALGQIKLNYVSGGNGGSLTLSAPQTGLSVNVEGSAQVPQNPSYDCFDLTSLINEVTSVIEGKTFVVSAAFDASAASGVLPEQLSPLTASLEAYVKIGSAPRAQADLNVSYEMEGKKVTLSLSAYYELSSVGDYKYNNVYLTVNSINGKSTNISVMCEVSELVSAVQQLISAIDAQSSVIASLPSLGEGSADVISALLSVDFGTLVKELSSDATRLHAVIGLDELLGALSPELSLGLGDLEFNYTSANRAEASLPALGLSANVYCAEKEHSFDIPAKDYLDLTDLVNTVTAVWGEVENIVSSQSLAFEIGEDAPAYITVDGITASVSGRGEISWLAGSRSVALDLAVAIGETGRDVLTVKVVYNADASDNQPIAVIALNNVALEIYRSDIEGVSDKISSIISAISPILGVQAEGSKEVSAAAPRTMTYNTTDEVIYAVLSVLSDGGWTDILNKMTLSTDGKSLALSVLSDSAASIEISAEDGLALSWQALSSNGGAQFATGAKVYVGASSGTLAGEIFSAVRGDGYILSTSDGQGGTSFIKLVYDYLFEALRSVSVDNILGSDVYNVTFELDGSRTYIPELNDVFVHAETYVRNSSGGVAMQSQFDFNVKGVVVKAGIIMENTAGETRFYVTLTQVGDVVLNGLKVYLSQSTLYETVNALVSIVCDTDILSNVVSMFSPEQAQAAKMSALALDEGAKTTVTDVLCSLLTADLSSAFAAVTDGGVTNACVDLDALINCLGLDLGYSLGSADFTINHNTHAMSTSAKADGMEGYWLTLTSRRLSESQITSLDYELSSVDKTQYIDLAFLPSLVEDVKNSATDDNGSMYESLTFRGSIEIDVVSLLKISISNLTVTVNLDADNFYIALQGNLSGQMVKSREIGLTYQNGYLTLYRGDNGGEYRVMTFEYFLDNMFASGDESTLNWLLGANSTIWNLVGTFVPEVSSGLTTPDDVYLYSRESQTVGSEVAVSDYINAAHALIGGSEKLLYQSSESSVNDLINALSLAGATDYYAFDINARMLTDGVLTKLGAAILRDGNGAGMTGIKAYGSISGYVDFTLNLSYTENDLAPCASHFNAVSEGFASAAQNGQITDGINGIFGCYNSADGSVRFSYLLTPYTLKVVGTDGNITEMIVREGSTVYLYDNAFPAYTDESKQFRLLYSLTQGGEPVQSFVMSGDTTIWALKRKAVELSVINSGSAPDSVYSSYVGDTLPEHFDGYATLESFAFADGTLCAGTTVTENTPVTIYGKYELASCTQDYINYTFNADDGSYHVTGLAAGYVQYYVNGNRTIVIADYINGLPVTMIDKGAFANNNVDADGNVDATKSVKNVIVPATVKTVGESAFANNVGMQSVVFLAESVHLNGSGDTDSSTYPFYGCSSYATDIDVGGNKGNEITDLNIYYNQITAQDNKWNIFRCVSKVIKFRFYIGEDGGSLNGAGSWIYAEISVNNQTEFNIEDEVKAYVADGLNKNVDFAYVQSALQTVADRYTSSQYGAIGYYVVSLNAQKGADGVTRVNVELTASADAWYKLTINKGAASNVALSGDIREFDGATYARGEVTFTAENIMTGYDFVSFSDGKSEIYTNPATFSVNAITSVVAQFEANMSYVNVISATDFNYAGAQYGASAEGVSIAVALDENGALLPANPAAEGYEFLGWASVEGGQMSFTSMTDASVTYYAVWGGAKEGITYSIQTSGTFVNTPAISAGSFENWYSSADYAEVISSSLSVENTVFHARRQYSFTYGISGSGTQFQDTREMSSDEYKLSYSKTMTLKEGQILTIERTNDKHDIVLSVDGEQYTTLKLVKFNIIFSIHYTFKDDYFANGEVLTIVPVDNAEYTFKY